MNNNNNNNTEKSKSESVNFMRNRPNVNRVPNRNPRNRTFQKRRVIIATVEVLRI